MTGAFAATVCGILLLATGTNAQLGAGYAGDLWMSWFGYNTLQFKFLLAQDYVQVLDSSTIRQQQFVADATNQISAFLGLSTSRIRFLALGRSSPSDRRSLLQYSIDYPAGSWDASGNPSLNNPVPAWQLGYGGSDTTFVSKWSLGSSPCPSSSSLCYSVTSSVVSTIQSPPPSGVIVSSPPPTSITSPPPIVVSSPSPSPRSPPPPPSPPSPPLPPSPSPPPSPFPQPPMPPTPPGFVAFPPPNPPPPSPPPPPPARRLLKAIDEAPLDVAYGPNGEVYEVFESTLTRSQAAAFCAARQSALAPYDYDAEDSKGIVDILCDAATGMQCWVAASLNQDSRCVAVQNGRVSKASCSTRMHPVCRTGP